MVSSPLFITQSEVEEAACLPHSPFPGMGNSSVLWSSLLALSSAGLGDEMT